MLIKFFYHQYLKKIKTILELNKFNLISISSKKKIIALGGVSKKIKN